MSFDFDEDGVDLHSLEALAEGVLGLEVEEHVRQELDGLVDVSAMSCFHH